MHQALARFQTTGAALFTATEITAVRPSARSSWNNENNGSQVKHEGGRRVPRVCLTCGFRLNRYTVKGGVIYTLRPRPFKRLVQPVNWRAHVYRLSRISSLLLGVVPFKICPPLHSLVNRSTSSMPSPSFRPPSILSLT